MSLSRREFSSTQAFCFVWEDFVPLGSTSSIHSSHLDLLNYYELVQAMCPNIVTDMLESLTSIRGYAQFLNQMPGSASIIQHCDTISVTLFQMLEGWSTQPRIQQMRDVIERVKQHAESLLPLYGDVGRMLTAVDEDTRMTNPQGILVMTDEIHKSQRLIRGFATLCGDLLVDMAIRVSG